MEMSININGIEYPISNQFAESQIKSLGGKKEALEFWQKIYNETQEKFKAKFIMTIIQEIKI